MPTTVGTYNTVTVTVTDAVSQSVTSSPVTFTVSQPGGPSISSFTALPSMLSVGGTLYLNTTVTGGNSPYTYAYTNLPGGCSTISTPTYTCTPSTPGTYSSITVTVTDSHTKSATRTAGTVIVWSLPSVSVFAVQPSTIPLGGTTYINVTATGGSTPYTYSYTGLPPGCASNSTDTLLCVPTTPGTYSLAVTVTDASGRTATSKMANLTVTAPAGYPSIYSFTASPSTITLGGTSYINVNVTGDFPPYSYSYSGLPTGCMSSDTNKLACVPTETGTFPLMVTVTDSANHSISSSAATLTVNAVVSVPTITAFSASPQDVSVNQSTTFTVVVSGGVTPYSYFYSNLPTGCSTSNATTLTCVPTKAGSYAVTVIVTDAAGQVSARNTYLNVSSASPGGASGNGSQAFPWWILLLLFLIFIVVLIVVLVAPLRRRGADRRENAGSSAAPPPVESFLIPPVAPQGYMDGLAVAPAEWSEAGEAAAYGTYHVTEADRAKFVQEVNTPNKTGLSSPASTPSVVTAKGLDAQRPWSLKITPEGIIVEDLAASSISSHGPVDAEFVKVERRDVRSSPESPSKETLLPSVTTDHAYTILGSLASKPHSLDGIKQEVPIDDVELFALLAALTQAKMIARGTTKAGGSVFVLTPLGRKLGRRFLEGESRRAPNGMSGTNDVPPATKPLAVSSSSGEKGALGEHGKVVGVGHPGDRPTTAPTPSVKTPPPSPQIAKGTHVQFEGTIGEERKEENPYEGDIKPEEVNPNVQHLDPKLLQPMEMRVTQDRGSDVRGTETRKDADARARELMERAQQSKLKRRNRFGSEQTAKPRDETKQ